MAYRKKPVIDRIMQKTIIQDDGCWIFTGAKNNVGYGMVRYDKNGKKGMGTTHRIAAEAAGMNITDTNVLHTCRNHACVNPAHLFTGTMQDVFDEREKDPKNPRFAGKLGVKSPTKLCPHCNKMIPSQNIKRHIECRHKSINI